MASINKDVLIAELSQTKNDCEKVLDKMFNIIRVLEQSDDGEALVDDFRSMAVPMIYSAWESHFTSSIAICFRALKDLDKLAHNHSPNIRSVWLQQENFFTKYIDMVKNVYDIDAHKTLSDKMSNMKKKVKKGHYKLTTEVLVCIDQFNNSALDKTVNVDDLVMTFSNVNKTVTEMNMEVVGLDSNSIDLSQLDTLVGLRNALGHGQFSTRVGDRKFTELVTYTKNLIIDLFEEVKLWLDSLVFEINYTFKNVQYGSVCTPVINSYHCDNIGT